MNGNGCNNHKDLLNGHHSILLNGDDCISHINVKPHSPKHNKHVHFKIDDTNKNNTNNVNNINNGNNGNNQNNDIEMINIEQSASQSATTELQDELALHSQLTTNKLSPQSAVCQS